MAKEPKTRIKPKQEGAKRTVDRILEATTEIISIQALDNLITNKIADAAHVNIATLHRYFQNKETFGIRSLISYLMSMSLQPAKKSPAK